MTESYRHILYRVEERIARITLNAPGVAPNGALFHHFVNSDGWSPFGRWGSKEFPNQLTSPKFKGLQSYITQKPLAVVPGD